MISVEDITYVYPSGVEALSHVSIEILPGEFVALMGENGAGKTTLVKHINGLLKPKEGRVIVDGVDTRKTSVAALSRKVGFVFQNPDNQFFAETVKDEIGFALKNFGFDEATVERRVRWAVRFMALDDYVSQSPFLLSGGEKKRLALASVLSWNPEVLILDEPTIGQDYLQKEKLMQLILQLNTQGRTVIIATHDVEFVAECMPRVVLMSGGRIVDHGKADRVLSDAETLQRCSVIPPQITQLMHRLSDPRLPRNVLSVGEAARLISTATRRG